MNCKSKEIENLKDLISKSNFKKSKYTLCTSIVDVPQNILFYNEKIDKNGKTSTFSAPIVNTETLKSFVAPFQRDTNNWSTEMKIKFVENIIMGCRTDITLYTTHNVKTNNSTHENCFILDGQHRILAILEFIEGKFNAFGFSYQELLSEKIIAPRRQNEIYIHIVSFSNENEAIEYYINMNENITHTPEDIEKAKTYLV